jgi:hypothetical protein
MALALETHMVEAVFPDVLNDEDAQMWLLHSEEVVVSNAATALGSAKLQGLSTAKEAAGDLVGAARVAWAARLVKLLPARITVQLMHRAVDLLEMADDPSCSEFETHVLGLLWYMDQSSERSLRAGKRRAALLAKAAGGATFAVKRADFLSELGAALAVFIGAGMGGWPCDSREGGRLMLACVPYMEEASRLSDVLWEQQMAGLVNAWLCITLSSLTSDDMAIWNPLRCGGEAALEEALAHYTQTRGQCGLDMQASICQRDDYRFGQAGEMLALFFGSLPPITQWAVDATAVYKGLDLPKTRDYLGQWLEVLGCRSASALMVSLNRPLEARALLQAMGFTWSDTGFALYDCFF